MTVIRPNSISGVTSITALANEINVFRHNGVLAGLQLNGVNHHTSAGVSTFHTVNILGNLDVAGVLTYQDVTNVDSVGIITARSGINVSGGQLDVGSNIKLGNAGVITATSFVASGTIETTGNELKITGAEPRLTFTDTDNNPDFQIWANAQKFAIYDSTNSATRLHINSGGNVGIGTETPDQMVHIHKGSAGSVSSSANTVLTLENSTTNILQFLNPNNTAAQVRFGDPQDDGIGFIEYSHSANTMSFGVYGPTRMQIDSNGHLGINVASGTQLANSKQLTLRPSDDDGIRFVRPGDGNNNPNVHLDLTTTTSGSAYPSGEAYTVKYRTYNCDQIFETYEGGGTGGHIAFKTAPQGGTTTERLTIHKNGGLQINSIGNVSAFTPTTSGITGGLVLTTPVYSEYHYTWSGHSSYTIDLTCASYFHAEFIYVQHQTNGGTGMHHYVRGKWANNHQTHTCIIHEYSGDGAGLDVSFVASDQNGNGSINGESNMTGRGAGGDGYTNGGGENYANTSSANGRLRITETYNWGSVSSRGLIVRVFYGSFAISKS